MSSLNSPTLDVPKPEHGYFTETLQPIYSALLVFPFLLIYELGLFIFRSDVINGGDAMLMKFGAYFFKHIGLEGSLISVAVLVIAFIAWQIRRHGSWKFQPPLLAGMFFESLFFAVCLFMMLQFFVTHFEPARHALNTVTSSGPVQCAVSNRAAPTPELRDFVLYCGAGVFEELVFRVCLLGMLMLVCTRLLHMEHAYAAAWSVLLGAAIFSAFHHIGGEKFVLNVFIQRVLAGLYFSALYFNRGFGIAAATHALYDILVGLNQLR